MSETNSVTILDLSSPSKTRRIAYLELLRQDPRIDNQILDIMQDIENVPATIIDYRSRERYMEMLMRSLRSKDNVDSQFVQLCSLRYLLGSLYINFEKFWGPTIRIITDLLKETKFSELLLGTLLRHLKETNDYIYGHNSIEDEALAEFRPDHVLHRNFVFQLLAHFHTYVEAHNDIFMEEFFLFVDQEIRCSPFIVEMKGIDLTVKRENNLVDPQDLDSPNEANPNDDETLASDYERRVMSKSNKRWQLRKRKRHVPEAVVEKFKSRETLVSAARVIQSFANIQVVHRESELKQLILDLLCCRDMGVQRAAFNCFSAYDLEAIRPYKDTIRKILNAKQVHSELSVFSLDAEESKQVAVAHRPTLIPIIQRIVYGRMISNIGKRTSGRDKATKRKDFVMRFIAGCTQDEIHNFFRLLFEPLFKYMQLSYEELETRLRCDFNVRNFIPLNQLQAMLDTTRAFMKSVGHTREASLPYCLKLINIITYKVVMPLQDEDSKSLISPKKLESLKAIRRSCIGVLTNFFKSFEYYSFSQSEMDFIFNHSIWPSCEHFLDRNYASVTPVLRLIETFCNRKVYHNLLLKRKRDNQDLCLLNLLMDIYSEDKTDRSVIKALSSMLADILHPDRDLSDDSVGVQIFSQVVQLDDEDAKMIDFDTSQYNISSLEKLPEGHKMLLAYIPTIFGRLQKVCQTFLDQKNSEYSFEEAELLLLSTLSQYLKESSHCMIATKLLISTLENLKNHDTIIKTLKAAQDLLKHVDSITDRSIITQIANILYYQRNIEQRHELCKLLHVIAGVETDLELAHSAINNMNCMSQDFLQTPDLAKWNEGFQIALEYIDSLRSEQLEDLESIRDPFVLLIHQVGFLINTADKYEFSIRDNCLIFYEKLSEKLSQSDPVKNREFFDHILSELIMDKLVKRGLRDTNDLIKHLHIAILRTLAMNCSQHDKTLGEFKLFCSTNIDVDFWLNIKHIQIHNRSKALARLIQDENFVKISPRTLSSYFMPLASGFLFNKNYKSLASLVDNAIKVIGLVSNNLNWTTYEKTLSYYLGLLTTANATYQRTNIKLITEILKNFNFDLTACPEALEHLLENEKLEKRMRKRLGPLGFESDELDNPTRKRLGPSSACHVYTSLLKKLIPRLNSCLHEMTRVEFEHDKNMADYMPEKDEIKRIPVAFAIVQLLNLLPCKYILLRDHLPALFIKLVSFLKSKNEQTRKAARATLIQIMRFVGPAYIPDLIRILRQNLDKGFYIHVLNYTLCSVLEKSSLAYGDLDISSRELMELCLREIFGRPSEDKEIAQVLAKTSEAKKTRGYDTLFLLASYISNESVNSFIEPLKSQLKTASDAKTVNKLSICLQRVYTGLASNKQYPPSELLEFIRSTIEESIPDLKVRQRVEVAECTEPSKPLREDRFLIGKEKTKDRLKSKINERGNLHMVIENALRLLLLTFEKHKTSLGENEKLHQHLDGFVKLLLSCLKSSSPRCITRALKCIHFIAQTRMDSAEFKAKCNSMVKKIFILLSLYNGVGMVRGDNYDMIASCFSTLTLLLLRCEHVTLAPDQLRALMSYIEQDLNDSSRQATALNTLHSVTHKKLDSPELPEMMAKVAELMITSSDESIRLSSTKIWQTYILEYSHGDRLQVHLNKFLRQLDYEYIDGRRSVLRMLRIIVERFPETILRDHFELFFYLLAQRVVNDESKEIRALVGRLIALLLTRLPERRAFTLNKFVLPWSTCDNLELNILGVKLMSICIEACPEQFKNQKERLRKTLDIIQQALEREDRANDNHENTDNISTEVNIVVSQADRLSYHALRLFKRLLDKEIVGYVESRFIEQLKEIWQTISNKKLTHRYEPVISTSCVLYMHFLIKTDIDQGLTKGQPKKNDYIERNASKITTTLCDKFLELVDKFEDTNKIHTYAVQNLIVLGQMIAHSHSTLEFEKAYTNTFNNQDIVSYLMGLDNIPDDGFIADKLPQTHAEAKKSANLMWLSTKVIMQARKEAALFKQSKCSRRNFVLRWCAAIAQELGKNRISPYVFLFMTTPTRELTDKSKTSKDSSQQSLALLSEDLLKFIKSLLGLEVFNKFYARVQMHYTKKRVVRKQKDAILRIKDQSQGVKRKLMDRRKKKIAKRVE